MSDLPNEALGFIPLDKGMDMQDELRETKARLAEAEATASTANHGHELCYKALLSAEARLAEAETALQRLIEAADDSDGCQYGTLSTYFVRQQCRHGLRLTDSADEVQK